MRLKRTLTEAEFAAAVRHLKAPSKLALALAHADLVQGINQAEVGGRHDRTKGAVCAASRQVWRGFLLSRGYEEVTAVLTEAQAFIVRGWSKDCLAAINGHAKPAQEAGQPVQPKRKGRPSATRR